MEANYFLSLPNIDQQEMLFLQKLMQELTEDQQKSFFMMYQNRRKDPQTILLCTLAAFIGVAGVQRFVTNQIGMGILYLFTGGLCLIGTIVDLINYKKLAWEYNQKMALESAAMIRVYNKPWSFFTSLTKT